jgi:hypothetical protein
VSGGELLDCGKKYRLLTACAAEHAPVLAKVSYVEPQYLHGNVVLAFWGSRLASARPSSACTCLAWSTVSAPGMRSFCTTHCFSSQHRPFPLH